MKQRQVFQIIAGVAGLFVLYAFNQIIVLAVAPFTAVNVGTMALVGFPFYFLLSKKDDSVSPLDIAGLVLIFLAGLSIALRAKCFLFLGLAHVPFLISTVSDRAVLARRFKPLLVMEAILVLIPIVLMTLILSSIANIYLLLVASILLCGVQTATLVVTLRGKVSGVKRK